MGGAVGATFGAILGGPWGALQGFMIGSSLGSALDPPEQPGQKVGELVAQTVREGDPRPIVYGTSRPIGGNIIAATKPTIVKKRHGKGGGGSTSEEVFRTYAIRVCEGPDIAYRRIWRNGALVYDTSGTSPDATVTSRNNTRFLRNVTLYDGSFSQMPDPVLQATFGVDAVPPHRGTAYMVMDNENLTQLAGAIPQWSFEVTNCATSAYLQAFAAGDRSSSWDGSEYTSTPVVFYTWASTDGPPVQVNYALSGLGMLSEVMGTAISPDGTKLVVYGFTVNNDSWFVYDWSGANPAYLGPPDSAYRTGSGLQTEAGTARWSPDSRYLAVGAYNASPPNSLYVYDYASLNSPVRLDAPAQPPGDGIYVTEWSPDGQYLVVGNQNYHPSLVDVFLHVYSLSGSTLTRVSGMDVATDGSWIAPTAGKFSPNGQYFALFGLFGGAGNALRLYSFSSGTLARVALDATGVIGSWTGAVGWSADSRYLAVVDNDANLHIWDFSSGSAVKLSTATGLDALSVYDFDGLSWIGDTLLSVSGWDDAGTTSFAAYIDVSTNPPSVVAEYPSWDDTMTTASSPVQKITTVRQ